MKKVMISQPMAGRTMDDIFTERNRVIRGLKSVGYEIVDTYFAPRDPMPEEVKEKSLYWLSKALEKMSQCDAVYFCKGYEKARGCVIEHEAAKRYGLILIEE